LLKPFTFAKFSLVINKLLQKETRLSKKTANLPPKEFFVKTTEERNRFVKIKYDDVVVIESEKNYVKIHTINEKITSYLTLKEIKEGLDETNDFIQIHRSFIISKNYIEKVDG